MLEQFSKRSAHETAKELVLKDKSGKPTDVVFMVKGYLSDDYQAAKLLRYQDAMAGVPMMEAKARLVASAVVGWKGLTANGKAIKYTADKAIEIVREYPEIAEQIEIFQYTEENFTKG